MILDFYFMPSNQITKMSLNSLRRRVETCNKTQMGTQMDKLSDALDFGNYVSSSGVYPLLFIS
jgi:hypothetical protein